MRGDTLRLAARSIAARWLASGWIGLTLLCVVSLDVHAQSVIRITSVGTECSIILKETLSLGALDDPATITIPQVTRTSAGEFVIADMLNAEQMLLYDKEGHYRDSFGRRGEGPGEFLAPGGGALRPSKEDGIMVLDPATRRITVLSATQELVSSVDLGAIRGRNFLPLPSDSSGYVVAGWGRSEEGGFAAVTQVVDADGAVLQRFSVVPVDEGMRNMFPFPLASDDRRRIWYAMPTEYAVEGWDPRNPDDRLRLEGRPAWFTPGPPQQGYPAEAPAPSVIDGLKIVGELLWIITKVADDRWPEAVAANPQPYVPLDPRLLFDSVVEVVNISTGTLVARAVHDEHLAWTGDGSLLYSTRDHGLFSEVMLFSTSFDGEEEDCPKSPH